MPLTTNGCATAMSVLPINSAWELESWIRTQEKTAITTAPAPTVKR
jgi:hypothetical protein